jgi:tetratricopeptide (TPR) repeat protein
MKTMLGRVDLAIEDLNDAIEIDPQYPMLYIIRGQALDLKGDCQAAIEDFEKAMSFDPDKFNTSLNIAWVLATCPNKDSRNGKRALELAAQALELNADHFNLHVMAAASAENGDFRKAIIYQNKAIQELKEHIPANRLDKTYHEKQLKDYLNQLGSYQNNIPWHVR